MGSVSLGVDAYCIVEVEGTKVRTPVHTNDLNPKFDYGGLFYLKKPSVAELKIQVWDHNSLLPDRFLGEVVKDVEVTDKTIEITESLRDGSVDEYRRLIGGTVTFKVSASFNLQFK